MPDYPKLTMAELEAAWLKLTAAQDAEHARALLAAIEINARTYASKPPHAATYGLHHYQPHGRANRFCDDCRVFPAGMQADQPARPCLPFEHFGELNMLKVTETRKTCNRSHLWR